MQFQIQQIRQHFSSIDRKFQPTPAFVMTRPLFTCRSNSPSFYKLRSKTLLSPLSYSLVKINRTPQRENKFTFRGTDNTPSKDTPIKELNEIKLTKVHSTHEKIMSESQERFYQQKRQTNKNNNSQEKISQQNQSPLQFKKLDIAKVQEKQDKQELQLFSKESLQRYIQTENQGNQTENQQYQIQNQGNQKQKNQGYQIENQGYQIENQGYQIENYEDQIENYGDQTEKSENLQQYYEQPISKGGFNILNQSKQKMQQKISDNDNNDIDIEQEIKDQPENSYPEETQQQQQSRLKLWACNANDSYKQIKGRNNNHKKSSKKSPIKPPKSPKKQHIIYYNQIYLYKPRENNKQNTSKLSYNSSCKQISPKRQSKQISFILTTPSKRNTRAPQQSNEDDEIEIINLAPEFSKFI